MESTRPGTCKAHPSVDVVVQDLAVACIELHSDRRLVGRDLEARHSDVTALKIKPLPASLSSA